MPYNIVKEMIDQTGKKSYILLTDGLSQIWEVKNEKEAQRIAKMMTENSDSGWVYKTRKSCERK
jgi:hypothetical protein|tara:strand:+ start:261 stop:452 length:192 start_codon:yes stop_codon:yes gene_type:complete